MNSPVQCIRYLLLDSFIQYSTQTVDAAVLYKCFGFGAQYHGAEYSGGQLYKVSMVKDQCCRFR
jgi:hypothetical protein